MMDLTQIASTLAPVAGGFRLRQATVVSNEATTSTLRLFGDATGTPIAGVPRLSHVTPKPGSAVWVVVDGKDMLIMGTVTPVGPPVCHVTRTADQTGNVRGGTVNNITWQSAVTDPWGMWSVSTPTRITVPLDGMYAITANVAFASDTTGSYRGLGMASGGQTRAYTRYTGTFPAVAPYLSLNHIYAMTAGSYLEVFTQGDQTANYTLTFGIGNPFVSVAYLGPRGS